MKSILVFVMLWSLPGIAQQWSPVDRGLFCDSLNAGTGLVRSLIVDENDDELYAMGLLRYTGHCEEVRAVAKWNGVSWTQVGNAFNYSSRSGVFYNDTLLVSGPLVSTYAKLNALESGVWNTLEDGPESSVHDFEIHNDTLFMGGTFRTLGGDSTFLIGKYYNGSFSGITRSYTSNSAKCRAIAHYQGHLYMGGSFYLNDDDGIDVPFSDLGRVEGDSIVPVGTDFFNDGSTSVVYDLQVFQDKLYIAGGFQSSLGYTGNNIMTWDGVNLEPVQNGTNRIIRDLLEHNGELYALGYFDEVNSSPCNYLAKWDGSNWTCLNQTELDPIYEVPFIRKMTIFQDQLLVGGFFKVVDGIELNSVASIDNVLGLEETTLDVDNGITVYPNPVTDEFIVELSFDIQGACSIELLDMVGRKVWIDRTMEEGNKYRFNIPPQIEPGYYSLVLIHSGKRVSSKLIFIEGH